MSKKRLKTRKVASENEWEGRKTRTPKRDRVAIKQEGFYYSKQVSIIKKGAIGGNEPCGWEAFWFLFCVI